MASDGQTKEEGVAAATNGHVNGAAVQADEGVKHEDGNVQPPEPSSANAATDAAAASEGNTVIVDEKHRPAWEEFRREAYDTIGPKDEAKDAKWFDDVTLDRFFRARSYSVQRALDQLRATDAWRRKINLNDLYAQFPVADFEASRAYYPRWTGRRDIHGKPLYVFRLASLDKKRQKEIFAESEEQRYNRIVVLTEFLCQFLTRMASDLERPIESDDATSPTEKSAAATAPISSVTTIIDLASASLTSLLSLRTHLQQSITLASAHYPETLDTIAIVNAPGFFPTVWSWVKLCFDEGTRRKIHVLGPASSDAAKAELRTLVKPEDLPQVYGGELAWTYDDEPDLDEVMQRKLGVMANKLPGGPLGWDRQAQKVVLLGSGRQDQAGEGQKHQ